MGNICACVVDLMSFGMSLNFKEGVFLLIANYGSNYRVTGHGES